MTLPPPRDKFVSRDYCIYACLFHATNRAYVGLTSRKETERQEEHMRRGAVCQYQFESGLGYEWVILERLKGSDDVAAAEQRWHDSLQQQGWVMLNRTTCGALGSGYTVPKSEIQERALAFETRGEFCRLAQSAYIIAARNGWLDEVTAHMRSTFEVRSEAQKGHLVSDEARAKMRAAKLGGVLSSGHKFKIAESTSSSWSNPVIRDKRMAGIKNSDTGRPAGWVLTRDEAAHLGISHQSGPTQLTDDQKNKVRSYRYRRDKSHPREKGWLLDAGAAQSLGLGGAGRYELNSDQKDAVRRYRYKIKNSGK